MLCIWYIRHTNKTDNKKVKKLIDKTPTSKKVKPETEQKLPAWFKEEQNVQAMSEEDSEEIEEILKGLV